MTTRRHKRANDPIEDNLHLAVLRNDAEAVMTYLENGTDVNGVNKYGYTAIHNAACMGHADILRVLIRHGADINVRVGVPQKTVLMDAVLLGQQECARLLLEAGADVNAMDLNAQTALMYAAPSGNLGLIRMLLDSGADVNAQDEWGLTALIRAAHSQDATVIQLLIERSANVNSPAPE